LRTHWRTVIVIIIIGEPKKADPVDWTVLLLNYYWYYWKLVIVNCWMTQLLLLIIIIGIVLVIVGSYCDPVLLLTQLLVLVIIDYYCWPQFECYWCCDSIVDGYCYYWTVVTSIVGWLRPRQTLCEDWPSYCYYWWTQLWPVDYWTHWQLVVTVDQTQTHCWILSLLDRPSYWWPRLLVDLEWPIIGQLDPDGPNYCGQTNY